MVHAAGTVKFLMAPEAFAAGVRVCSAAEANAVPVAEYTLAAIILGAKRAFTAAARYRRGLRSADGTHRNLDGISPIGTHRMTVGVVGASRIGRKVVRLLRDVLDADVLIYDPYGAGDLTADPPRPADLAGGAAGGLGGGEPARAADPGHPRHARRPRPGADAGRRGPGEHRPRARSSTRRR